jgi:uncharacterized membrane protein YvbJ
MANTRARKAKSSKKEIMMTIAIIAIILIVIALGICFFVLWALSRLNKYIGRLENQIEEQLDRIDELEDLLSQSNIKNKKVVRKNLIPDEPE